MKLRKRLANDAIYQKNKRSWRRSGLGTKSLRSTASRWRQDRILQQIYTHLQDVQGEAGDASLRHKG